MEECKTEKINTKRSREDPDSAESKRVHTVAESNRVNSDSSEVKQIREEILDILDEQEILTGRLPEVEELDSVMKSFEQEIVHPSIQQTNVDSVDPQLDLGYLLEASDNELGLPPTVLSSDDHVNAKNNVGGSENVIEFEKELLPSHELGLLDYQESLELSQRTESMPA
uniref:Putative ovule protein n=1 Tax=Solanum chacoense TaxID=4108 RepID=A0A0V0H765_SOLCH